MMDVKVKLFNASVRLGKMQDEVNEFIRMHDVGQVSMSCTMSDVVIMVVYKEG
jgi:hypothetical protein